MSTPNDESCNQLSVIPTTEIFILRVDRRVDNSATFFWRLRTLRWKNERWFDSSRLIIVSFWRVTLNLSRSTEGSLSENYFTVDRYVLCIRVTSTLSSIIIIISSLYAYFKVAHYSFIAARALMTRAVVTLHVLTRKWRFFSNIL